MAVYFPLDISEWTFIISRRPAGGASMDIPSSFSYQAPDLHGRVALVAGATRGVGRGTALALGEAGGAVDWNGGRTGGERNPREGGGEGEAMGHARAAGTDEETTAM